LNGLGRWIFRRHDEVATGDARGFSTTTTLTVAEGPSQGLQFAIDLSLPRVLVGKSPVCEPRPPTLRFLAGAALEIARGRLKITDPAHQRHARVAEHRRRSCGGETVRIGGSALRIDANVRPQTASSTDHFGRVYGATWPVIGFIRCTAASHSRTCWC
jgi:hypothetical protein